MEIYTYKGISDGKYVEGDIEALNQDEASHKLKEQKIIITNLVRAVKGKKKEDKETKGSQIVGWHSWEEELVDCRIIEVSGEYT